MPQSDLIMVQTSFSQQSDAQEMAALLIQQGLVACAQVSGPTHSSYRWKSELRHEDEYILSAKTTAGHYPKLAAFINENHPYELPEIIATNVVSVNAAYLDWVRQQCPE